MRIFIVLVALVASAMASPYEEKQDKDDLVYNSALQSLDNTEINDADPSVDDEGEHAEEQELSDFGAALEDTTQQEYNDAEELAAPSEAPMAIEQSQAAPSEAPMAIEQSQESGFKKVYSFDMKNSRQRCPSGFKLNTYGSKRLCGRPHNRHGCASITVQVRGMRYNQVRGRVIAYQYSSPDGFNTGSDSIDGVYVDGISITYGRNPRKHVWTLGAGLFSYRKTSVSCPGTGYGHPQPAFVGNNYFCTSGNFATGWQRKLYDVPLWSTVTGNCRHCNGRYNVPYFCAQLPQSTNQNLEIRVCGNQGIADEDIKIEAIELYIK